MKNEIKFKDGNNGAFSVKTYTKGEKPTLDQMQFLANVKMKRLGTPHSVYGRVSRNAVDEANRILKIYDNLDALIIYFTKL